MRQIPLHHTDLKIGPIAFGCNVFGWTINEEQSISLLDELTDKGLNMLDTADIYSAWAHQGVGGQSETIIGRWLARSPSKRSKVVIATKGGATADPDNPYNCRADYIKKAVDASLARLGTDSIDLYYTHFDDGQTPLEETLGAYDDLIKAGKIRFIGASNISAVRLAEALRCAEKQNLPRYVVLQEHYNLAERQKYEDQLRDLAAREQLNFFPYFSLASGFLTGKYRCEADLKKSVRGVSSAKKYLTERGLNILSALDQVAEKHSSTPAAVALSWLASQRTVTAPLASATSSEQLDTLLKSAELQLEEPDLSLLNSASAS